jgi:hypothetical protein
LAPETVAEMVKHQAANSFTAFGLGYEHQATVLGPRHTQRLETVKHDGGNRGFAAKSKVMHPTGDGLVVLTNGDRGMKVASALDCAWIMPTSKLIRDERGVTDGRWPPGRCMGPFNQPSRWKFWTIVLSATAAIWTLALAIQILRRQRRFRVRKKGSRTRFALRVCGPLLLPAAWLITLYTSWIASLVYGAHGMIPYGVLGPGIHGVTVGLLALGVVISVAAWFPKDEAYAMG